MTGERSVRILTIEIVSINHGKRCVHDITCTRTADGFVLRFIDVSQVIIQPSTTR